VAEHYIDPVSRPTGSLSGPCRPADRVPVGQFKKKIVRLVGRLGSGPRLVADRADVVFTHTRIISAKINYLI